MFAVDDAIVDALNEVVSGSALVVTVLQFVTGLGGAQAAWLLIPLAVVWLLIRRLSRAAVYVAATGLGAAVLDPAFKALLGRARPLVDDPVASAPGPSFPSGHALGATVTYGLLLLIFLAAVPPSRRRAVAAAATVLVVVVGLSRVALAVHHPTDVLAGWSLGVLWLGITNVALMRPDGAGRAAVDRPGDGAGALRPAPRAGDPLPEGARSAAVLVLAAVLLWGALLGLGELLSDPRGVVLDVDAVVIDWLVSVRTEWLSDVAALVGRLGGTVGIVTGLVVAAVVAVAVTRRWRPALFLITAVAGETAIFLATVTIVERGRPTVELITENLPPTPSFPSGHAAAAVALYGAVALLVRAWAPRWAGRLVFGVAIVVALGVALSRLYRGVHYPTDVFASILYTSIWLAVCWRVLRPGPTAWRGDDDTAADLQSTGRSP